MNLKFKEDRFWFALALSTIPLFYIIPQMNHSPYETNYPGDTAVTIMGFYVLFYLAGWVIYGVISLATDGPKKENSKHFNPTDRIIWLEERVDANAWGPNKKHVEELSYLKEKYKSILKDIKETKEKRKREYQLQMQRFETQGNILAYGSFAPQIVCPHCQTKGKVRTTTRERVEESREKGVIGATIGKKTITKKGRYTQLHCDVCDVTWEA